MSSNIVWIKEEGTKLHEAEAASLIPDMHIHSSWCYHSKNILGGIARHLARYSRFGALNEHLELPHGYVNNLEYMSQGMS